MTKAEELFQKLDQNSDGSITQEEFIAIVKQDQDLLNVLQNTAWNNHVFSEQLNYIYFTVYLMFINPPLVQS